LKFKELSLNYGLAILQTVAFSGQSSSSLF